MTEGEQVYTALELAMNAAGARFFEVPFRPSSYFSNRLTKRSPSINSMGGTPSRLASFYASEVNKVC